MSSGAALESIRASAFTVATDGPESDGTLEWDSTTMVLVEATAGGRTGIGYTYSHASAAAVINSVLGDAATGLDALRVGAAGQAMRAAARNLGTTGLVAAALSAVDCALWDLKGRLLGLAVVDLLDAARPSVPVYGSGGFCTYTDAQLADQLAGWVEQGIGRVKMKVGREPELDEHRARVARAAIGPDAELYVDANGALNRAQAADWA